MRKTPLIPIVSMIETTYWNSAAYLVKILYDAMRTTYTINANGSFGNRISSFDFKRSYIYPDVVLVSVTGRLNYSVAFCDILLILRSTAALF